MKKIALMVLAGLAFVTVGAGLGYVIFEKPWGDMGSNRGLVTGNRENQNIQIPETIVPNTIPSETTLPLNPQVVGVATFDKPIITDTATSRAVQFPNATFLIKKTDDSTYEVSFLETKTAKIVNTITDFPTGSNVDFPWPKIQVTPNHDIYTWTYIRNDMGLEKQITTFVNVRTTIVATTNHTTNTADGTDEVSLSVVDRSPENILTVGYATKKCLTEGEPTSINSLILNNRIVLPLITPVTVPCTPSPFSGKGTIAYAADWLNLKGLSPDFSKAYITFQDKATHGRAFPVTIDMYKQTMINEPTPSDFVAALKQ